MHHVSNRLTLPPSSELVDMHGDWDPVDKLPAGFNSKPVKSGSEVSIASIEFNNPVVDLPDLLQPVHVTRGWWAGVREPGELWRVEECSNHQLILGIGVELILLIYGLPEVENAVGDTGVGATLQQVIDSSREKDPHGSLVLGVIHRPGILEGGYGGSRYGDPVNMEVVRGTGHIGVPGPVKLMELTVTDADVQAILKPGGMVLHAGGAHVGPVGGGPLYPLHDPGFNSRVVVVEQEDAGKGPWLPVAADVAHPGWHDEDGGQRAVLQVSRD